MAKKQSLRDSLDARNDNGTIASLSKPVAKENEKAKPDGRLKRASKKTGKALKEMFSELKKVNWPTLKVTLASLGTVLVVVLFFLAVVMGTDTLWSWLLKLLVQN